MKRFWLMVLVCASAVTNYAQEDAASAGSIKRLCRLSGFIASLLLLGSIVGSGHDLGISSMSLKLSAGKLEVLSSYARGDFQKLTSDGGIEKLKNLSKDAVLIEVDGKPLPMREDSFFLDDDGVVFKNIFGAVSGTEIKVVSLFPPQLSPDHRQIVTIRRDDDVEVSRQILFGNFQLVFEAGKLTTPSGFMQFLSLGIKHILSGFDHLLFLLALLLTVKSAREAVSLLTYFTIAHSISLALVTLNILRVSPVFVESLIALSIIFVGLENIFKAEHNYRWLLTYAFGLIHGLGFASALQELGLGQGKTIALPLLSFNAGVEVGQLAFALLLLPIIWKLRTVAIYRSRVLPVCSGLIAFAGFYWLLERASFSLN